MLSLKFQFALFFVVFLSSCPFDENREIERKLAVSESEFHELYNQGNFQRIYAESDEELKSRFTEDQFTAYLETVKTNIAGVIKQKPHVWINDEMKDWIKRLLIKRTKFSNVEMIANEKAIYREHFEWNLNDEEVKITSYKIEKLCDKPCRLAIN